jgi:hypothetical protein
MNREFRIANRELGTANGNRRLDNDISRPAIKNGGQVAGFKLESKGNRKFRIGNFQSEYEDYELQMVNG